jgi:hypothetical protein
MDVVDIDRGRYALQSRHWERAREHLLFRHQLPVIPLAVFLYRDFAFEFRVEPGPAPLVLVFREEFGYPLGAGDAEFDHVYSDEGLDKTTPYFQPL